MTDPLPALPPGARPPADGAPGQPRPATAVVLTPTRQAPLIESAGRRWLVSGAPPLPPGAKLSLASPIAGTRPQTVRLLAIGERVLAEPIDVRLQPVAARPNPPPAGEGAPRTLQVEARLIGPTGQPLGPPLTIGLSLAADPAAPGAMLPAEIVRRDPQGRLLLTAAGTTLRLESPLDLPAGARLLLALPQGRSPAAADDAAREDPLRRAIALLLQNHSARASAGDGGALRLPAPDHALAARLLRWVQALTGDERPADGPASLRGAVAELARQASEPQAAGWRVLTMPIGTEEPQALKLCLRRPAPDPDEEPRARRDHGNAPQRAVFEVELSHLGRCQLDVLCQQARFDLVVRTTRPLGATSEAEIRSLIDASRAAGGLSGRLEFATGDLLALPDPPPPSGRHLTV